MLARRDTRLEAARLRRLSPLQTVEDQSQTWGIRCHSCTEREGLPPSWKLSYKTYVLRFTRESRFSFNQRIARILMCYQKLDLPHHSWYGLCITSNGYGTNINAFEEKSHVPRNFERVCIHAACGRG